MDNSAVNRQTTRWAFRDSIAALSLFVATAAFVLWQNSRLAILWDLSYLLDNSFRISLGQLPYRDFPFVHAPLTFLLQAALIRVAGRVFFHHVLYAAIIGGLAAVLAWRIALHSLIGRAPAAWEISLMLASPLTVLGIYSIFPHPFYDCDCVFSILIAIFLLQRLATDADQTTTARTSLLPFATGAALVLPLFFKQNIGLPFLLIALLCLVVLIVSKFLRRSSAKVLLMVLAGAITTLFSAGLLLHFTVGIGNYIHWTVQFAAQRRMPGISDMLGIYQESALLWMLPSIALALLLLHTRFGKNRWTWLVSFALLAAPFLSTLLFLFSHNDPDDRAANLLALWPLLLILSAALTFYSLRRGATLRLLIPVILLATIHGTLLSQQLWGSTYAIWPLLMLLVAEMIAFLAASPRPGAPSIATALSAVIAATLLFCGGFYAASEERLSYAQTSEGELVHSALPQLAGMAVRGSYLPGFDQLVRFTETEIPRSDGIILIPGEDPFYFVTGRVPQFPLLLFDNTTDPYSPAELAALARARSIRWLIVKRNLQLQADPTPQSEATLKLLKRDFTLYRLLDNYEVYRR